MENNETKQNNVGNLRISEDVIATIASVAAMEIDGVAAMAPAPVTINALFKRGSSSKSVKINFNDDAAILDLFIDLKFGESIPAVCEDVQRNVKQAVQTMTGITVLKVNIHIQGIVFHDDLSQ